MDIRKERMFVMKIELWSDFSCPFCYIAKRQLEAALEKFPHKEQVTITYRSYLLRPDAPKDIGKSMAEVLAERRGIAVEEARNNLGKIAEKAAMHGLTYHFDTLIPTNTFDAHRLTKFAETKGKDKDVTERLLDAYFRQSRHIGDVNTLMDIAVEAGLDRAETGKILNDATAFKADVLADFDRAKEIGVRGVPYFLVNGKHTVVGSQMREKFLELLHQWWDEETGDKKHGSVLEEIVGEGCIDGSCDIPTKNN